MRKLLKRVTENYLVRNVLIPEVTKSNTYLYDKIPIIRKPTFVVRHVLRNGNVILCHVLKIQIARQVPREDCMLLYNLQFRVEVCS